MTVDPSRVGPALVCHTSVALPRLTSDDVPAATAVCASYVLLATFDNCRCWPYVIVGVDSSDDAH